MTAAPFFGFTAIGSVVGLLVYAAIGGQDWLVVVPLTVVAAACGCFIAERLTQ